MNNYVYKTNGKLYINLTNKCSNNCDFCIRHNRQGMEDTQLWLSDEATFEQVIQQLPKDMTEFDEVTFCGFGEPTENIETLRQVGEYLKTIGKTVRVNTNGQGNLVHGRNIVDELKNAVDIFSVSLNCSDSKKYQELCHCIYGEKGFDAMLEFAINAQQQGFNVMLSVVDVIPKTEIKKCQKLCDKNNLTLRVRHFE